MHLLAKEPGDRPQSAREVVETLNRLGLLSGLSSADRLAIPRGNSSGSIPVVPAGGASAAKGTAKSSRSRLIGVWATVILVLCLGAFLWTRGVFAPRSRGNVRLSVNPADASVFVDGEKVAMDQAGLTTLTLAPGTHKLLVSRDDYVGEPKAFEVAEGDNPPLTIELKKRPGERAGAEAPAPVDKSPRKPKEEKQIPSPVEPPRKQSTTNEAKETPARPAPPRKVSVPEPAPAKINNSVPPRSETGSVRPGIRAEDTPVQKTIPPPPLNRLAARWVLEHGGVVHLKVAAVTGDVEVRNVADLPRGRFDVVQVSLAKRPGVDDDGVSKLAELKELAQLDLSGTAIRDAAIGKLRSLRALTSLFLCDTALTDAAVPDLRQMSRLKHLDLHKTNVSPAGVSQLRAALPLCEITEP
jgi:hypothetical protein